jgi:hypothetical protein
MSMGTAELVKLPEVAALTDMQLRFVMALISGDDETSARDKAGYAVSVHPSMVAASPSVQRAIRAAVNAELRGPLKLKAMRTLNELLAPSSPAATRFNAAKLILEHGEDGDKGDARPMTERSVEELEAMITELEGARNARLKDVTPSNGA